MNLQEIIDQHGQQVPGIDRTRTVVAIILSQEDYNKLVKLKNWLAISMASAMASAIELGLQHVNIPPGLFDEAPADEGTATKKIIEKWFAKHGETGYKDKLTKAGFVDGRNMKRKSVKADELKARTAGKAKPPINAVG
jgi:hypothetical protein